MWKFKSRLAEYTHMQTHTQACAHKRKHTHICTHTCTHARTHTHICTHTCTHARTHTHTHTLLAAIMRWQPRQRKQSLHKQIPTLSLSLSSSSSSSYSVQGRLFYFFASANLVLGSNPLYWGSTGTLNLRVSF